MSRRRIIQYRERTIVISDCRSLIPIDGEAIKRVEQEKCKAIINRMDLARESLRRFNEESQPAFQAWVHSTFGREITGIRELAEKLHGLERLLNEVERYKYQAQCSYSEAYRAVIGSRDQFELPLEDENLEEESFEDFEESNEREEEDFEPEEERFAEPEKPPPPKSPETDGRLKVLYRTLARRLHPDLNGELDQKRKELWYQVQDAYDAKDIEKLETLSAMSEIFDDNSKSVESIWSLKNLFEELLEGLGHLQRQINRCKKDVAWGFEKTREQPKKIGKIREQIASQMQNDKDELTEHILYCEEHLERWKSPPPSSRSRRQKSSGSRKRGSSRSRA
jgi:hypothetical protein